MVPLSHLSHHALRVADVERSIRFYRDVVGIDLTERGPDGTAYMRRGPSHHALALYPSGYADPTDPEMTGGFGLDHVAFAVPDRSDVDEAARVLKDAGATILAGPVEWDEPGGPYGVRFRDPEENRIEICAGMAESIGPEIPHAAKPTKLGHVILNAENPRESAEFFTETLGFRVSDWIEDFFVFLRCNPDHHATGMARGPARTMHHTAYEVADIKAIKDSADVAWKNGVRSLWGIGRHGPGHNLFVFYPDPDGNVIEIFAELDQILDEANYKPLRWEGKESSGIWNHDIPSAFFAATRAGGKPVDDPGD